MGRGGADFDSSDVERKGLDILDEPRPERVVDAAAIAALAARVPEGGFMATVGDNGADITDALTALEDCSLEEFLTLPVDVLYRVYETAEDANWHKVAGLAYQAWQANR